MRKVFTQLFCSLLLIGTASLNASFADENEILTPNVAVLQPSGDQLDRTFTNYGENYYGSEKYGLRKVTVNSLRLVGRGIENRKTGELLAVACGNENCHYLRSVYFTENHQEAYFFGRPIEIFHAIENPEKVPTDQEIKSALRKMTKQYKQFKRRNLDEQKVLARATGFAVEGIASGYVAVAMAAWWPFALGVGVAMGGILVFSGDIIIPFKSVSPAISTFSNQAGWNWAVEPKKVRPKKFDEIFKFEDNSL